MNESDVRLKLIDPVLKKSWDADNQIFTEYYFTDGEIIVRKNLHIRKKPKKADYLLMYRREMPIAIVEAKDSNHTVEAGLQQAMDYLKGGVRLTRAGGHDEKEPVLALGDRFDRSVDRVALIVAGRVAAALVIKGRRNDALGLLRRKPLRFTIALPELVRGRELVHPKATNLTCGEVVLCESLAVGAVGKGDVERDGVVHRLREAGLARKVLYLADRNILVDQTIDGDFKPLRKVITKVEHRKLDPAYEIYFALYQQLVGTDGEEIFREFSPEFFDLIIVDECHRGSAADDSAWRKILEYFSSAVQIGMTATPKETKDVSNIDYFGEPVYTYSLKQGIEDGFLAPYQVVRVKPSVDVYGWRPEAGTVDDNGELIDDRVYEKQDFDRDLVIKERTDVVAKKITQFLKETDRYSKTIVFCVDIDHAERMRQALVNENSDIVKEHPTYIMRITGDSKEGKSKLDEFIDPDEKYPTIVTTSKLLTTGVNCKTCKLVVLDNVYGEQGMTEFKQIVGRGTRICEPYGKLYFTILDFRDASRMFADPAFDGEPVQIFEPAPDGPMVPDEDEPDSPPDITPTPDTDDWPDGADDQSGHIKYYVHGVPVEVVSERVEYYSVSGDLVTESLKDYTRKNIRGEYDTLDHFLVVWNAEDRKQVIIDELKERGVFLDEIRKESGQDQMSDFDLICHIAYDQKPLTRSERANNVKKKGYLYEYTGVARDVLETLLDKYATSNLVDLDDTRVLDLEEFRQFGSPMKICKAFGGKKQFIYAVQTLENALYSA